MSKVRKVVSAGATVLGVAVVLSGCSDNVVGGDGPRPGVAAAVGDTEITLDEIADLTQAYCALAEEDPQLGSTSREYAQAQLLQERVWSEVIADFAEQQGIEVNPPSRDLVTLTGWEDLTEDQQQALEEYVDARDYAQAVGEASGAETPDPADFDVVINPKFDLAIEDGQFVPADDRLSVGVSDLAGSGSEQPTPEELRELPDSQLCGQRPEPEPPLMPAG